MRPPNTNLSVDPELELPKVEKLLYSLAWDFAQKYGLSFDEARSNSYVGFMKACRNFKPDRGMKFSSWCRLVTWGQHKSLIMRRAEKYVETVELNEELVGEATEVNYTTLELCEKLPARESLASTLCRLICEAPAEMMEVTEGLSEEAQEIFFLFLESPKEIIKDRSEEVAYLKEQFARKHGKEKSRTAFQELCRSLAQAFA